MIAVIDAEGQASDDALRASAYAEEFRAQGGWSGTVAVRRRDGHPLSCRGRWGPLGADGKVVWPSRAALHGRRRMTRCLPRARPPQNADLP